MITINSAVDQREQTRPFASIASMEIMVGERSRQSAWWRGAGIGATAGFVVTTAAFLVALNQDDQQTCECVRTHAVKVYVMAPVFIAGTGALGGWIGTQRRERWKSVSLPVR
ncbi:MAG: hypothetical protein ABI120_14500 [Gemmatimonadaceae bacterium]